MSRITIIGAGLAGLMTGLQAARHGNKVTIVSKGWGATHWLSGCIDVLGYWPVDGTAPVESPEDGVAALVAENPQHPYGLAGVEQLARMLEMLREVCAAAGYPMHGSLNANWLLPSAVGTQRPTCLAPEMMIAGDLRRTEPMLIVGFKQLMDFFPNVVADNLTQQGTNALHAQIDLPELRRRSFINPTLLAGMLESAELQTAVAEHVRAKLNGAKRVGFPSVLGHDNALAVKQRLEELIGVPVFEIPSLTPSVPGMRLHRMLVAAIQQAGGRIENGMEVIGMQADEGRVKAVYSQTAARPHPHVADQFVLATGGILGGGITTNSVGEVHEAIFDLPVTAPEKRTEWFYTDFLDKRGHPIYQAGVPVNGRFQPIDAAGQPIYTNLYAAGTTLAHCEPIRERSFEGVALVSGFAVAEELGALVTQGAA